MAPVSALLRKVAPKPALASHSRHIHVSDIVDRDELMLLSACGYLRVPVVEDAGSFAVRGALLDVFPPHAGGPLRIELDDELVTSIKRFDPDTQRTLSEEKSVFIHPARQTLTDTATRKQVRERVSDLCDSFNLPSRKRSDLLDDLENGRSVLGIDGLLPAFHGKLDTVFAYLPSNMRCVIVDPTGVAKAAREDLERAHSDRASRVTELPAFPVADLYINSHDLRDTLERHPIASVHTLAVSGAAEEEESPLSVFESVAAESVLGLGGKINRACWPSSSSNGLVPVASMPSYPWRAASRAGSRADCA